MRVPTAKQPTAKQRAYRFFYANAGSSYDPKRETKQQGRARGARLLAKAERDAANLGYTFSWREDYADYKNSLWDHAYWCQDAAAGVEHTHEVWGCVMLDENEQHAQSLWAIIDPSAAYRRVVEAELALEELGKAEEK